MLIEMEEAIKILEQEGVIAVPTETVYGLAAKYNSQKAIEKVFAIKGRDLQKALTVNISSYVDIIEHIIGSIAFFEKLAKRFWPGPLTIVVDVKKGFILPSITGGKNSCGFRIPRNESLLKLLAKVGPVVLPSANFSGRPSCKKVKEIHQEFGEDFPILKGDGCQIGVESTVIALEENGWRLLRLGAISKEEIQKELKDYPQIE